MSLSVQECGGQSHTDMSLSRQCWTVGWRGGFAVFMCSISVPVGGFHPSTTPHNPVELTAQADPHPVG